MPDIITVKMPALPQNTLALRLLVAGLANLYHFNSEEIEDVKLSVSEACFCAPESAYGLHLRFILDDVKMTVEVETTSIPQKPMLGLTDAVNEGFGFLLMRNLMDSMEYRSGEEGFFIRLVKHHKSSVQAVYR